MITNIEHRQTNRRKLRIQRAYDRFYVNPNRIRDAGYMQRKETELRSMEAALYVTRSDIMSFVAHYTARRAVDEYGSSDAYSDAYDSSFFTGVGA